MHPLVEKGFGVWKRRAEQIPSVADIKFSGTLALTEISATYSSRSTVIKGWAKTEQSFLVDRFGFGGVLQTSSINTIPAETVLSSVSPSGQLTVELRKGSEDPKLYLRVISKEAGIVAELDVSDKHADFLTTDFFGKPTWHSSEKYFVYVAEEKARLDLKKENDTSAYAYEPDFGDTFATPADTPLRHALLCLDLRDLTAVDVKQIEKYGSEVAFVQPVFSLDHKGSPSLFATGVSRLPDGRRLGILACVNRPTAIYHIILGADSENLGAYTILSDPKESCSLPRVFLDDGSGYLTYLSNIRGGSHASCAKLMRAKLSAESGVEDVETLVDRVQDPGPNDFPGIYTSKLSDSVFLKLPPAMFGQKPSFVLCLTSPWRSQLRLVTVNLDDGTVVTHQDDDFTALQLVNTDGQTRVVAVRSSIVSPPQLLLGYGTCDVNGRPIFRWTPLKTWKFHDDDASVPRMFSSILRLPTYDPTEAILLSAKALSSCEGFGTALTSTFGFASAPPKEVKSTTPVFVIPHGGPNGLYDTSWSSQTNQLAIALVTIGFTVAIVNYPGSIGFGQKTIYDLEKACGELDVGACQAVLEHLIKVGIASPKREEHVYAGRSHGGFIGGHLLAKYPDSWGAAILCNGVFDLPSCFVESDIPDWSLAQVGVPYDFDNPPAYLDDAQLEVLRNSSPSYHMQKLFAKNPDTKIGRVLLEIGLRDRRVPPSQGKALYHLLMRQKQDVRFLAFPENGHPIVSYECQRAQVVAELEFLVEQLELCKA